MKSEGLKYKEINAQKLFQIENLSGAILTNEMLIDKNKSINFFQKKLKNFLHLNKNIKEIKKVRGKYEINNQLYDYVINCTYYQKFISKDPGVFYEVTSSIIYKCSKEFPALTVMDGPFFTIYPYKKNLYNIYSVIYSPFGKSKNFNLCEKTLFRVRHDNRLLRQKRKLTEKQILKFYPNFLKYFKFTEYLTCIRTTNNSSNANRSYKIHINKNFISIFSGKIDHVNLLATTRSKKREMVRCHLFDVTYLFLTNVCSVALHLSDLFTLITAAAATTSTPTITTMITTTTTKIN
jgi:hypothetical protein